MSDTIKFEHLGWYSDSAVDSADSGYNPYWYPVLQYGHGFEDKVSLSIEFDTQEECDKFIREHVLGKTEVNV